MEDVVTDAPPPSRFSPDDLDNFAAPPSQPTPILVLSPNPGPAPRLLIVLISPSSLALLPSPPPPLHASLLLPDLPLQQSHAPVRVYLHPSSGALLAAAHGAVPAHRARAAARSLISALQPKEILVLDAVRSGAYRGRLAADEPLEGKVETRAVRRLGGVGAAKGVAALAPPWSVMDGLGAAVMAEQQLAEQTEGRCGAGFREKAGQAGSADGEDGTRLLGGEEEMAGRRRRLLGFVDGMRESGRHIWHARTPIWRAIHFSVWDAVSAGG